MWQYRYSNELYHHGIKGQKWGVQNGPPYPLDSNNSGNSSNAKVSDNKRSKKNQSDDSETSKKNNNKHVLTDKQKKYIAIGTVAAASIIAGVALYKTGALSSLATTVRGKSGLTNWSELEFKRLSSEASNIAVADDSLKLPGKSRDIISSYEFQEMLESINSNNFNTEGGKINCTHTTVSYIMNTLFGTKCTAAPFNGVDEASGIVLQGRDPKVFSTMFNGIDKIQINPIDNKAVEGYISGTRKAVSISEAFHSVKNSSTGIVHVSYFGNGHVMNYEKDAKGIVTLIDPQNGNIIENLKAYNNYIWPVDIYDFTNASIKESGWEILKRFIIM